MKFDKQHKGFTLVELTLSISFIAILLLAIAMFIIQLSGIYNKGLTLREANQGGQFVSSEIQRTLNQTYSSAVEAVSFSDAGRESGGRLCAGGTVYAWNYPDTTDSTAVNKIKDSAGKESADVRFAKFSGSVNKYCRQQGGLWEPLPNSAIELLAGGNANIALHSFSLERLDVIEDTSQTIYTVTMVVGTPSEGLVTEGNSRRCKAAGRNDDSWCAVNEFTFTARSGNKEALQ